MPEEAAGEGASVRTTQQTITGTAPNPLLHQDADSKQLSLQDIIPAEYKDKEYLSKYEDIPGLFKGLDNLQETVGKKPFGIPQDNATEEEKNKFYNELGRPETAEGYKFEPPAEYKDAMDTETISTFSKLAHENGTTQKQFENFMNFVVGWQQKFAGELKTEFEKQYGGDTKKLDDEFDGLVAKHFGDRQDAVLKEGKQLLETYLPTEIKPYAARLNPEALIVIASFTDVIKQKFIDEGGSPGTGGEVETGSAEHELRQELSDIKNHKNPLGKYTHTNPNYQKMNDRVLEIQREVMKIENAKKAQK